MQRTTARGETCAQVRRREKDKEMKRRKREMYAQEVSVLKNQVKALRMHLRTARLLLPWRDVAEAIHDDAALVNETNGHLRSMLRRLKISHDHMRLLVQSSQPFSVSPALGHESWKDAHLFRGSDIRQSGFDYISQLALHTMPSMLHAPASAADDTSYVHAHLKGDVAYVDVLHACLVPHATLDQVMHVAWAGLNDFVKQAVGTDDCVTALDRMDDEVAYMALKGTNNVAYNSLHRMFRLDGGATSPPRAVIIARSILTDEVHPYPSGMLTCDSVEWTVIEPVDAHTVSVRVFCRFSQPMDSAGRSPLSLAQWLHKLNGSGERLPVLETMSEDQLLGKIANFFALRHDSMQAMICAKFSRMQHTLTTPHGPSQS